MSTSPVLLHLLGSHSVMPGPSLFRRLTYGGKDLGSQEGEITRNLELRKVTYQNKLPTLC